MKTSEQIDKISAALAKAQGVMENPIKNRTAKIQTKSGKEYSYNYADLPVCVDTVRKVLSDNELAAVAMTSDDGKQPILTMRLIHSSGQWFESSIILFGSNEKEIAACHTYYRRYLFMGLTGIAGDEDTDGPMEGFYEDRNKNNNSKNMYPEKTRQNNKPINEPPKPKVESKPNVKGFTLTPVMQAEIKVLAEKIGMNKDTFLPLLKEITKKESSEYWTEEDYKAVMGELKRRLDPEYALDQAMLNMPDRL